MEDLNLGYLGTLGMHTNPESQPIRAPRRVDFSAKQRQKRSARACVSSEHGVTSLVVGRKFDQHLWSRLLVAISANVSFEICVREV